MIIFNPWKQLFKPKDRLKINLILAIKSTSFYICLDDEAYFSFTTSGKRHELELNCFPFSDHCWSTSKVGLEIWLGRMMRRRLSSVSDTQSLPYWQQQPLPFLSILSFSKWENKIMNTVLWDAWIVDLVSDIESIFSCSDLETSYQVSLGYLKYVCKSFCKGMPSNSPLYIFYLSWPLWGRVNWWIWAWYCH